MTSEHERKSASTESPAPRRGLQFMGLVLVLMALLAVYSNVQKAHRDTVETVTIAPAPSATPSATAAAP